MRGLPSLALTILGWSGALTAQSVRGTVYDNVSGQPLPGVLVTVADAATGRLVGRTSSRAGGNWAVPVAVAGAEWRVTVLAIGYSPQRDLMVRDQPLMVRLIPRPFELPPLVAQGIGAPCRDDQATADIIARILDEAATTLALVETAIESRRMVFETETWRYRVAVGATDTIHEIAASRADAAWPLAAPDASVLRDLGFVVDPEDAVVASSGYPSEVGRVYFGPDASVLFSDWFLASHCFALSAADTPAAVALDFQPTGRTAGRVDIAGRLTFDRRTLALTRATFRYVGLPRWVPPGEAGGELVVEQLPDGLLIIRSWRLRAPIPVARVGARPDTYRLGGWAESGGRVVSVEEP